MQEQQQKLDLAIKKLEAEANNVIRQGEQMYRDAVRSAQEFSGEVEKQVQDLSRSAEQFAQESQRLRQVPETLQQKSKEVIEAAQSMLGRVRVEPSKTPTQTRPEAATGQEPFVLP